LGGVFGPNLASSQSLDQNVRSALADSLGHIWDVASDDLDLNDLTLADSQGEIRSHPIIPGLFGRYYDLVFSLDAGRYSEARTLFREIADLARGRPSFDVVPFSNAALGSDEERYARLLSFESPIAFAEPDLTDWMLFRRNVGDGLDLLKKADAELEAQVRGLAVQVVGASPDTRHHKRRFGGASSFMLWGMIVLNVREHSNLLDLIAGLVHETGHQLLFGLALDEPLVENAIEERYSSPLRSDGRPMDGIFHATFVCARVHYAYAKMIANLDDDLNSEDRDSLKRRLFESRQKFFKGLDTIKEFGRLTSNGDRIISAASDYMRHAG
jgi:hypothetical protein